MPSGIGKALYLLTFTFAFLTGRLSLCQVSPRVDRHGKAVCSGSRRAVRVGPDGWRVPLCPSPGTLAFCSVLWPK